MFHATNQHAALACLPQQLAQMQAAAVAQHFSVLAGSPNQTVGVNQPLMSPSLAGQTGGPQQVPDFN